MRARGVDWLGIGLGVLAGLIIAGAFGALVASAAIRTSANAFAFAVKPKTIPAGVVSPMTAEHFLKGDRLPVRQQPAPPIYIGPYLRYGESKII